MTSPLAACGAVASPGRERLARRAGTAACLGTLSLLLLGCVTAPWPAPPTAETLAAQPEAASARVAKPGWQFSRHAVAAAHPLAAEAGLRMLRAGGTAVDAAVAVQMVLALVEPQSSGIGGGAFLLHWDGQAVAAWDGRETAPAAARDDLLLDAGGQPLPFAQAVASGRSVGVPGAVRMLEAAHRAHGRLPWRQLFEPAIELAELGFPVGERLHTLLRESPAPWTDPQARAYFFQPVAPGVPADRASPAIGAKTVGPATPWPVGHRLRNPALAQVLRRLANEGSAALHEGAVAADIVQRVQHHPTRPGMLAESDLATYQPLRRAAWCSDWPGTVVRVCGMPPPSSGHLAIMQILGLLAALPSDGPGAAALDSAGLPSAEWLHAYAEASRLAFADRAMFVADPAFVPAPGGDWQRLLAPDYLAKRAALIGPRRMDAAPAGEPAPGAPVAAAQADQPERGTSHLSIVDDDGHAVAMTTTIEAGFGAGLMSDGGSGLPGGFLLNNQLTDFSFLPRDARGRPVANRVEPGKRPRSSMSPTLVFDRRDGRLLMSLGSPGGAVIIHFTAKTLLGTLAWGLTPQAAIDLPNFGSVGGPVWLERGGFPAATRAALAARGHGVDEVDLVSGIQALQRSSDVAWPGWRGGADPRREGVVVGD